MGLWPPGTGGTWALAERSWSALVLDLAASSSDLLEAVVAAAAEPWTAYEHWRTFAAAVATSETAAES